jgi:hypothetical protein
MKVSIEHGDYQLPAHSDRDAYRIRIDGKNGSAIEIVEQLTGGFLITEISSFGACIAVSPVAANAVIVSMRKP